MHTSFIIANSKGHHHHHHKRRTIAAQGTGPSAGCCVRNIEEQIGARLSSSKKRSTPSHISSKCGSYRRCSGTPAPAAGVLCLRRRRPPPPPPPPAWPSAGAPSGPAHRKGPSCSSLVPRRREPSPVQLLVDCCARFHQEKIPWLGESERERSS